MGNLSQEYKNEIQEIFGEIYAKYIKEELQATVDSEVSTKLKTTADGISKQTEQSRPEGGWTIIRQVEEGNNGRGQGWTSRHD